jgi:hypothetical protein
MDLRLDTLIDETTSSIYNDSCSEDEFAQSSKTVFSAHFDFDKFHVTQTVQPVCVRMRCLMKRCLVFDLLSTLLLVANRISC